MRKLYITGLLILDLISSPVYAQELSIQQKNYIKKYIQTYFGKDWQSWKKVMEAMAFVESKNGAERIGKYRSGKLSNCYGIMQVKPSTARDMIELLNIPDIYTESELIEKLTYDDEFNIHLSARYLKFLFRLFNDADLTIIGYNVGQGFVLDVLRSGEQLPMEYLEKVKAGWN